MTGGNVYLSGDKAAAQSLIPEAQQCAAITRAMRDALELKELERVFTLTAGSVRVVLGEYTEQIYITPKDPEPPEEEEPEEEIDLDSAPILYHKLAMPWRPEGILFTPTTEETPFGLGLPMRDVDTGAIKRAIDPGNPNELGPIEYTPNGTLCQVLMNRFANNKYMDNLLYVNGLPPEITLAQPSRSYRLSEEYPVDDGGEIVSFPNANQEMYYATTPRYGHPHSYGEDASAENYADRFDLNDRSIMPELAGGLFAVRGLVTTDADNGGLVDIQTKTTQEIPASALSEPEQAEWYSHRPEEMLYPSATKEHMFRIHNEYRLEVGTFPFRRQLRGDGEISDYGLYMMSEHNEARYVGHSHYSWMPGFRTAGGRAASFSGQPLSNSFADNPVENLVTLSLLFEEAADITTDEELARYIMELWKGSPGHYAGIIAEQWDSSRSWQFRDYMGGDGFDSHDSYGTCLNLGAGPRYAGIETLFDVNAPDSPNGQLWNENPAQFPVGDGLPGLVSYSATFDQRSTWLPAPHQAVEVGAMGVGGVGFFCGGNRQAVDPNTRTVRYFNVDNHLVTFAPNVVGAFYNNYQSQPPGYPWAYWEDDSFMTIAGVHPYDRDGETWIRVAYWETNCLPLYIQEILNGQRPNGTNLHNGTDITMKVATFPLNLIDTHVLPWRDPIGDAVEWVVEDERTWTTDDAFCQWSPTAEFTSDGNKFCFQVFLWGADSHFSPEANKYQYKGATNLFLEDYSDSLYNGARPPNPRELRTQTGYLRGAIPHTVEWSADEGFVEQEPQEVLSVNVDARNENIDMGRQPNGQPLPDPEGSMTISHYESIAQGSYNIFPHYDESDELQHVQLVIDYYSYQRQFTIFTYWHIKEGHYPAGPKELPFDDYLWCQMKMVFPSGKEFVYHQTNISSYTVPSYAEYPNVGTGEIYFRPFYDRYTPHESSPYQEGGNFVCYILHIDVHREDVIYLKSTGHMYRWNYGVDRVRPYDITVLDSQIIRDWSDEDDPVIMWEKLHTPPVDGEWVHGDYYGHPTQFPDYKIGSWNGPIGALKESVDYSGWFSGASTRNLVDWSRVMFINTQDRPAYADQGIRSLLNLFHENGSEAGYYNYHEFFENGWTRSFDPNFVTFAPLEFFQTSAYGASGGRAFEFWKGTPDSYQISAHPSNVGQYAFVPEEYCYAPPTRTTGSVSPANIYPLSLNLNTGVFDGDPDGCHVRVLRYKDRWLIRIKIGNLPFLGPKPENIYYEDNSLVPNYIPAPYRPDPSGDPLLVIDSNFDLDEAAGMEGVTDIYPCGVLY